MTVGRWMDQNHVVHVATSGFIAAYEDYTTGNPATDIVSLKLYTRCTWIIIKSTGDVGTATITVESCDTAVPGTPTAIAFTYWVCTTPDTWGEATAATSAGFITTAGADSAYAIEINSNELSGSDSFARLQFTEVDGTAQDGAVVCILSNARYDRGIPLGALV